MEDESVDESLSCSLGRLDLTRRQQFYETGQFSDLKIICQNRTFNAHVFVMVEASDHFSTMLSTTNFIEGKTREITFKDTDPELLEKVIRFIYGFTIHFETVEQVFKMALLADMFWLQPLMDACVGVMDRMLTAENALEMYTLARQHPLPCFAIPEWA